MGIGVRSRRGQSSLRIKGFNMTISERNIITGETRVRLSYVELGKIVLDAHGSDACQSGYGTTDPEWVGRNALNYGDINPDGTLN
jgi:hypothetical protein